MSASTAIILILVVVWIAALTPTIMRKIAERDTVVSVDRFHDSLRVLRLAHPRLVAASQQGGGFVGPIGPVSRVVVRTAAYGSAGSAAYESAAYGPAGSGSPAAAARAARRPPAPTPLTAQRRRRVLTYLGATLLVTALLGAIPSLRFAWDLSLIMLVLTAAYIGLLVHFHRVAVERAQKVIWLHGGNELRVPPAAVADRFSGIGRVAPVRAAAGAVSDPFGDTAPMEAVLG